MLDIDIVCCIISFCSLFHGDSDVNSVRELKKHHRSNIGEEDDDWDYFLFVETSPSGDCYFEVGAQMLAFC